MVAKVVGTPGVPEAMTIMLTSWVAEGLLIDAGRLFIVEEVVLVPIKVAVIV